MFETVINLKPKEEWRPGVTIESLTAEMDKALQFPGVSNAWTMPIKARIDMLATGIRTPVAIQRASSQRGNMRGWPMIGWQAWALIHYNLERTR
jgi:Cu(I)/Ag(I) efflux system membrane protein CusA/SilA